MDCIQEIREKLSVYSLSSCLGLIHDIPAKPLYFRAGGGNRTACGKAFTVKAYDAIGYNAFQCSGKDDFVVVAARGNPRIVWGGIGSKLVARRGGAGVVVDGGLIGEHDAASLDMPTYFRFSSSATAKHCVDNELNVPVELTARSDGSAVTVNPGDIVAADAEGIVVIRPSDIEAVVSRARYVEVIARFVWGVHGGRPELDDLGSIPGYPDFWREKGSLPDEQESLAYVHYYAALRKDPRTRRDVEGIARTLFPGVEELFE